MPNSGMLGTLPRRRELNQSESNKNACSEQRRGTFPCARPYRVVLVACMGDACHLGPLARPAPAHMRAFFFFMYVPHIIRSLWKCCLVDWMHYDIQNEHVIPQLGSSKYITRDTTKLE